MGLIAKIRIVALVDGVRTEFEPGTPVDGLSEHDIKSLTDMGALEDTALSQAAAALVRREIAKADADFQRARLREQARQAALASAPDAVQAAVAGSGQNTSGASDTAVVPTATDPGSDAAASAANPADGQPDVGAAQLGGQVATGAAKPPAAAPAKPKAGRQPAATPRKTARRT